MVIFSGAGCSESSSGPAKYPLAVCTDDFMGRLGRLGLLGRLPIFMATWRVQAVGYPLGTLVIGLSEWALWMQDTLAATVVFVEQ